MSIFADLPGSLLDPFRKRSQKGTTHSIDKLPIFFGGQNLPYDEATQHFLAVGTTGSGKTIMLRLLMQSALIGIGRGDDTRALVYDAKQDMMSILSAYCDPKLVRTTNPFDTRGVSWDLSKDVREPRVAVEIAYTLIPNEHESQPFFSDAARHIVFGVMVSFILSGHDWSLADIARTLRSKRQVRQVLRRYPETRQIIGLYFYDKRLLANIMSTIASKMLRFEPIAAAWESAAESISLEEWTKSESILVLGNSETSRVAIDAINRCMFKRAADLTLSQTESFSRRSWFILDEVAEAGRLDGLVSLLKKGRSKGAAVVLALQSVSGLRDQRMYGPHFTDEILGQIGNRFFGRLECPATADWASRLIGDQEVVQLSHSSTSSSHGSSSTTSRSSAIRRAILPSEFMSIPPTSREDGVTGYFLLRREGCFLANFSGDTVFQDWLEPNLPSVPDFVPREITAQYLAPWKGEQAAFFGIDLSRKPKKKRKRSTKRENPKPSQADEVQDPFS
ncbi:MAG: type IV secretion system DNA-binding domain-containing protein [Planctomycetota bacterium]|nr:type IV secretion system DNA-binding domain-containing protein [Planctomycetota bacterium]